MLTHLAHPTSYSELHFEFEPALRLLSKKVKDCETTNGHVGRRAFAPARTLMKDARRGLIR